MKRVVYLIVFSIFCHNYCTAQHKVSAVILDVETGRPVGQALVHVLGTKIYTDSNGTFSFLLKEDDTSQYLSIKKLGYESKQVLINRSTKFYKVYLRKYYSVLNEVLISTEKLKINNILNDVIENIDKNYSANTYLLGSIAVCLFNDSDTLLSASAPLVIKNNKKDYLNYKSYIHNDSTYTIKKSSLDQQAFKSSVYPVKSILSNDLRELLKGFLQQKSRDRIKYGHIISTFEKEGRKYFDVILYSLDTFNIKYSGLSSNQFLNSKKGFVSIKELHIESDSKALVFYQSLDVNIEKLTKHDVESFKDRNELAKWIENAKKSNFHFIHSNISWSRNTENGLYTVVEESFLDNKAMLFNKSQNAKKYSYRIQKVFYKSDISRLDLDVRRFFYVLDLKYDIYN